ncbi:MAG: toll/interleukin-1 receptor domain-containing protein [Chloroflexi bacterium]|nr:toll/interleukin-1 receptor domain-containing protein [Chloroflexota bacterium]
MPEAYHIFMSYSRSDAAMMRGITEDLRRAGFTIWNDEALEPGTDSWKSAIQTAIECSAVVVVLLSPDAKKSEWIERELDYARAFKVPIIPALVRGDTQSAVPFLLISVQRADMRQDYQAGLRALQEAVCDILKLPDLCPDQPETPTVESSTTISTPTAPATPVAGQPMQFAGRLRLWNPVDYVKLVVLYLFNPVRFYAYDPKASRALAVWLASTLFWLPFAINVLAFRLQDIPVWGLEQEPLVRLPGWIIAAAWLLTGLFGQVNFDVRTGLRAFLRGPLQMAMIVAGLAAAVLYMGTIVPTQPILETRDGLIYLLTSPTQQVLIIAGALSVFVGAILASNLARGVASWLGIWLSVGFLVWCGLVLYIPVSATLQPVLPPDTSESDITARGMVAYASVICCLGVVLLMTGSTVGAALRQRQVGRLNFLLLVMLVAAYGMLLWVQLLGRGF